MNDKDELAAMKYEQLFNAIFNADCLNEELIKILNIIDKKKYDKLVKDNYGKEEK